MTVSAQLLDSTLRALEREVLGDRVIAREFAASRAGFFAYRAGALDALAERRHREWFLLERFSPALGGVPLEVRINRGSLPEALDGEQAAPRELALAALLSSLASVFEVDGVVQGEGVWVRDLAGGGEYALEEPEASHALAPGDLLVGRAFAVGEALHRLSPAAGIFRDQRLRAAVEHDLERARGSRRGSLRLSQAELEKMFWGGATEVPIQGALSRARVVLSEGGLSEEQIDAILIRLESEPFEEQRLLHGVDDALGEVLADLAFDSQVDLAAAHRALLEVWIELGGGSSGTPSPTASALASRGGSPQAREPEEIDVRAALAAFEQGREEGRDLEQLFSELERNLDLDAGDEQDGEPQAPDFPGVVSAMVEEYLWDVERERGAADEQVQAHLRKFARFSASIGVFENLSRRDLLAFGAWWLPEFGGLRDPADARAAIEALEGFCAWSEEQQAVPLRSEFLAGASTLADSLARVTAANLQRELGAPPTAGELYEVRAVEGRDLSLVDRNGRMIAASLPAEIARYLRPGDSLRAELRAGGGLRLLCCYPPESALLVVK